MQLHQVKRTVKNKTKKIVGRGGKRGTYSGKGLKGQKSRAGHRMRPELRDIIIRLPKRRGYKFTSVQTKPIIINIGLLNVAFEEGNEISPLSLFEKKLIKKNGRFLPAVKLLGNGDIDKKFVIVGCQFTVSAKEKIEKAGGTIAIPPVVKTVIESKTKTVKAKTKIVK